MIEFMDKLYTKGQASFYQEVKQALGQEQKMFVVTANPETLMIGEENKSFGDVLRDSKTTIVPDGIGVVKGANMLGIPLDGRITGVDLSAFLLKYANAEKKKLYLYGAKEEVLQALMQKIKSEFPNIQVVGYQNGYQKDSEAVFLDMVEKEPDIVLVALGIPKQELLIHRYYDRFQKGIFVGVGGTFDVLSGTKKRAPSLFIKLNLEWAYRLMKEPSRIKRFYRSNVKFIGIIKKAQKKQPVEKGSQ